MRVFKFGGASVKDADAIRNVADILRQYVGTPLVVVISALGKTTNALEAVVDAHIQQTGKAAGLLQTVCDQHLSISRQLIADEQDPLYSHIAQLCGGVVAMLGRRPQATYGFVYDQIVSLGELLSTRIVSAYLQTQGIDNDWIDVRLLLRTDNTYREGQIQWKQSQQQVKTLVAPIVEQLKMVITQGFLGGTIEGFTTTLGREGSDYTAAVFANMLDADNMTVWKDVPGILNADPRLMPNAIKIAQLSYYEAIEMTYYGAHVIHPKTIKPLQNKGIPLHVRSFVQPDQDGTVVSKDADNLDTILPPVIVVKANQLLLSVVSKDFSFMAEENLSRIYEIFARHRIKTNLTQNAAISFSACIDNTPNRIKELLDELEEDYSVKSNAGLSLVTIRHYTPEAIAQQTKGREIVLEQKSRYTIQMLVR